MNGSHTYLFLTTERIMATGLHVERAIVLGRSGDHTQALRVLVHEGREPHAAQAYCHRAAQERSHASGPGDAAGLRRTLLLTLLFPSPVFCLITVAEGEEWVSVCVCV